MARLVGVDLPRDKRVEIGLTYIYGIGLTTSKKILAETGVDPDVRIKDLTEDDLTKLRDYIQENIKVEGDLHREVSQNVKRLMDSVATAVCVIVAVCPSAASARTPMRAPARAPVSKSAERKSEVARSGS